MKSSPSTDETNSWAAAITRSGRNAWNKNSFCRIWGSHSGGYELRSVISQKMILFTFYFFPAFKVHFFGPRQRSICLIQYFPWFNFSQFKGLPAFYTQNFDSYALL
jgi:hypothetical protein